MSGLFDWFLGRWGFVGVPLTFLLIVVLTAAVHGVQNAVNGRQQFNWRPHLLDAQWLATKLGLLGTVTELIHLGVAGAADLEFTGILAALRNTEAGVFVAICAYLVRRMFEHLHDVESRADQARELNLSKTTEAPSAESPEAIHVPAPTPPIHGLPASRLLLAAPLQPNPDLQS